MGGKLLDTLPILTQAFTAFLRQLDMVFARRPQCLDLLIRRRIREERLRWKTAWVRT